MSRALDYAHWVLAPGNEKRTGRFIKLAAKRFLSDLQRTDIYFDEKEAGKFITFAEECCCLWEDKWRGKPVVILPWMAFILEQIYGWYYTETELRRVRKVYVQVAKKNAKSSISAIMALYHLFSDDRIKTPKVFVGANNEEQAKICVNIAGKIVENSPDLYEYVEDGIVQLANYNENITRVIHRERDGFIKPMSKETESKTSKMAGGKHGFNPSFVLIDEYSMADSASQLDALESAQAAREEPLEVVITTAGHKKDGPCFTQIRRTGIEVIEGIITDDSYLVFIYEMDKRDKSKPESDDNKDDSIYDETIWEKCNPNIEVSVFKEFLRSRVRMAKNEGGSKEVDVRTLNFNEWCDTVELWIQKDVWDKNTHGITEEDLLGKECYGGIQIVSGLALNAFVLVFPIDDILVVKPFFWMPQSGVVENRDKTDFGRWVDQKLINTSPGNVIENKIIFDWLLEEISKYNLHSIAMKKNIEMNDIVQALVKAGITCNPISQGYAGLSTPTKLWEELLSGGKIDHMNNLVLTWANSNCMIKRSGDDIRVEESGGRTSGISAAIMALAQWKTIEATRVDDFKIESW